ncbi:hypothetical protein SSP24_42250 [Streptomyces spinoverrucosus]|uniref:Uncharacterized protein n=1 Tax=Streptomyces spinoverrucosus TaxID=284043 RepID=A0A4Y3VL79_9ACTN|nr:hypothetical protein SSP24_42250 [Streptomyces spinoverrucosus]GHB54266.1 hypothetical protein GCM10010397_25600 [Streptomyces spinoverrucosus]
MRPAYPILGASSEDETNDHLDDTSEGGGREQQVTVTQDRLGKMLTREKVQGNAGRDQASVGSAGVRYTEGPDGVRHRTARSGASGTDRG